MNKRLPLLAASASQACERELRAREEPFTAPSPTLSETCHDYVSLCNDNLKFRKATAAPPSSLSPAGEDIVPTTYEGGYKLWECAVDLVEHLHLRYRDLFQNRTVLELGAGHALPSILAARLGARRVDVNDYNVEVLRDVTMRNVAANVAGGNVKIRYFSGGWGTLPSALGDIRAGYDVILSAETTYAARQCDALAECILRTLAARGVAFVAGKSYYFGVGGGMRAFEKEIRRWAGRLGLAVDIKTEREVRDGVSNVREVVAIRRCG